MFLFSLSAPFSSLSMLSVQTHMFPICLSYKTCQNVLTNDFYAFYSLLSKICRCNNAEVKKEFNGHKIFARDGVFSVTEHYGRSRAKLKRQRLEE